jgi:hypothetical protein
LLEPERFGESFAMVPDFEPTDGKPKTSGWRNTKDYRGQLAEWQATHEGVDELNAADADKIEAMHARVKAHPVVKLLRSKGGAEVSIRGELCGVPCKSRLDRMQDDYRLIVDLKSARSLATHSLERAVLDYGYHIKAAFYRDLLHSITGVWASWLWLFQASDPPYDVRPWQPPDCDLECGRAEYRRVLVRVQAMHRVRRLAGHDRRNRANGPARVGKATVAKVGGKERRRWLRSP